MRCQGTITKCDFLLAVCIVRLLTQAKSCGSRCDLPHTIGLAPVSIFKEP